LATEADAAINRINTQEQKYYRVTVAKNLKRVIKQQKEHKQSTQNTYRRLDTTTKTMDFHIITYTPATVMVTLTTLRQYYVNCCILCGWRGGNYQYRKTEAQAQQL
jgi:hypothetical protein